MGWYHDFLSKIFSITVQKNFVANPSLFLKIFRMEKMDERWGVSRFSVAYFCRTVPEEFVRESSGVSENLG